MAWRWRKSVGLPGGGRATASTTGIGVSWGFSGLRIGRSPSGRFWISFAIPGTGISFIRYLPKIESAESETLPPPLFPPSKNTHPAKPSKRLTQNQAILEKIKKKSP